MIFPLSDISLYFTLLNKWHKPNFSKMLYKFQNKISL